MIGLEPTRRKAPDPKSGMATNYITSAVNTNSKVLILERPSRNIIDMICSGTGREGIIFLKHIKQKKALISQGFFSD